LPKVNYTFIFWYRCYQPVSIRLLSRCSSCSKIILDFSTVRNSLSCRKNVYYLLLRCFICLGSLQDIFPFKMWSDKEYFIWIVPQVHKVSDF